MTNFVSMMGLDVRFDPVTTKKSQANRLINETSPYLLQHAHNPVNWYPWGKEALDKAKAEQKPIFLSVGYSACHWCHVMETESFEHDETAALLNANFINIKVDREERPDLDHIYMSAVQAMTHQGGWPMSVFLTPELEPFYGGTYFPPEDRHGMPSFRRIICGVANAWNNQREEVSGQAKQLVEALRQMEHNSQHHTSETLAYPLIDHAVTSLEEAVDAKYGGLGNSPKFFHTMDFRLCLRHWKKSQDPKVLGWVTHTLDNWIDGGIYDHLGGGFHRYSTDPYWLAPHFEKMLYDNALVAETLLEAFQVTQNINYVHTCRETLDYVLREMTSPEGGFYSTQDADTEGEEGTFYVWTKSEIESLLDADVAKCMAHVFELKEHGNWEGKIILRKVKSLEKAAAELKMDIPTLEDTLALAKRKLFEARSKRPAPNKDEKVLVSWNGLMISTMARAHQVLGDERYLEAARNAANFIISKMAQNDKGTLWHCYKNDKAKINAFLDDYAHFSNALLSLYESDFDEKWIREAIKIKDLVIEEFWDADHKSFYFTPKNHEPLITRPKDSNDGATPSGLSMMVTALLRLGNLTGDAETSQVAIESLQSAEPMLRQIPRALAQMLVALDFHLAPPKQICLAEGSDQDEFTAMLEWLRESFNPHAVIVKSNEKTCLKPFEGKAAIDKQTTAFVCQQFTCQKPVHNLMDLKKQLDA